MPPARACAVGAARLWRTRARQGGEAVSPTRRTMRAGPSSLPEVPDALALSNWCTPKVNAPKNSPQQGFGGPQCRSRALSTQIVFEGQPGAGQGVAPRRKCDAPVALTRLKKIERLRDSKSTERGTFAGGRFETLRILSRLRENFLYKKVHSGQTTCTPGFLLTSYILRLQKGTW